MSEPLLRPTGAGLYCEAGDFHVDPWAPVDRAVVTHGHSDHARWGCRTYLGSAAGAGVLRARLGPDAEIAALPYGKDIAINGVKVSLHPAGHILGSAQVRVEHRGEVWVVSGDYKVGPDATCAPFEPVRCHTFVTECTFGLPIYRWEPQAVVFEEVNAWWRRNVEAGRVSILYGYALGKAQRLLSGLDPEIGPIFCHGAVENLNRVYREAGVALPPTEYAGTAANRRAWDRAMIIAPPSAHQTPWMRKFGPASTAFASGWMSIRGARRRRSLDQGFVLSDHVDWPTLLGAIEATGATRVLATHGYTSVLTRWLRELGVEASVLETQYGGKEEFASASVEGRNDEGEEPGWKPEPDEGEIPA